MVRMIVDNAIVDTSKLDLVECKRDDPYIDVFFGYEQELYVNKARTHYYVLTLCDNGKNDLERVHVSEAIDFLDDLDGYEQYFSKSVLAELATI